MSDLRNHLCWAPETASATISTEAVNPSAEVFLATHAPLRISRSLIKGRDLKPTGITVDERTVLRDFLESKLTTGTLLMPVVGDSGSGKSHLVRWVREHIPSSARRRVIYLEKSETSLKSVVEKLLEGVEGDSLDQLRKDVRSFSEGVDEESLSRRLINALNEALAKTGPDDVPSRQARVLSGPKGLASLLQDPYIQQHLLAPGKYIPQYAAQLLNNRDLENPERAPGFSVEDLPLEVQEVKQASVIAQRLLEKLLSIPNLRQDAVDMLNTHMESAVKSASNIGTGRLAKAMLEVREAYETQDKEIILLVEDFALIQGVQRELLEALTEAATREGRQRYASMRTLMAVTTGYFRDLPETVMSRVSASTTGYVYDLDQVFDEGNAGVEEIASFAGRYLNAARVGREELERAGGKNFTNACENCSLKTECHESFGLTSEGYGLYPFNRSSLLRMAHSVAPSNRPWAFVPRTFLGSVIRPVLVDSANEIRDGSFPAERLRERFRTAEIDTALPTSVDEFIGNHNHVDPHRHRLILEFWADAPDNAGHIEEGIRNAFGLPVFDEDLLPSNGEGDSDRGQRVGEKTVSLVPRSDGISKSLKGKLQRLEDWAARDKRLDQVLARELRTLAINAVTRRYLWSSPLMKELPQKGEGSIEKVWPAKAITVSIEGAGENLPGVERAPISFLRNATNSQFFQSLLLAQEGAPGARSEATWRLARIAENHGGSFSNALVKFIESSDESLVVGLKVSLVGAALAGRAWPGMSDIELMDVAFDDGSTWKRGDLASRVPAWRLRLENHLRERASLVGALRSRLGISQGVTGAVRMIDAARALPLVLEAARSWRWDSSGGVPKWVGNTVSGLSGLEGAVSQQVDQLKEMVAEIRSRAPRGGEGKATVDAIRASLEAADTVGLSPNLMERQRILQLAAAAEGADWRAIAAAERDLESITSASAEGQFDRALVAAARDHGASLQVICAFLVASDTWLTRALADARERHGGTGDSITDEVQTLLQEWAALSAMEGTEK
ncbi:protein DpdH [Sphaerimonospora thailandensis]|uniref:ATP-binding protein n=1 Tax=Sphaerimonospora thailandensis TaxID=795644 RepID=A0A8J3RCY3_9ACTN|nr:protein DpdH [Sphaerimonospora thailandensis]GIH72021.1 hypothetical protein Mth01_42740 [Sphaerimonospora thailandensis]